MADENRIYEGSGYFDFKGILPLESVLLLNICSLSILMLKPIKIVA